MAVTVIVIESDSQVQELICLALGSEGYTARGVDSYDDAVRILRTSPADLAVCDGFTVGGLAGISMLHRLFPQLRLILVSESLLSKTEIPLPSHLVHVLRKPCVVTSLLEMVQHALVGLEESPLQEILERGRFDFFSSALLPSWGSRTVDPRISAYPVLPT